MKLHQEWVTFEVAGVDLVGYVCRPRVTEKLPAILVIPEIWSTDEHIQDVTQRFAKSGYLAMALDIYARGGTRPANKSPERIEATKIFLDSLPPSAWMDQNQKEAALEKYPPKQREEISETLGILFGGLRATEMAGFLEDLQGAALYLSVHPHSTGLVGSIGFCMGGALSIQLAAASDRLKAACVFYGMSPGEEIVKNVKCPVRGFYGGLDKRITDTVPMLAEQMETNDKSFGYTIYEDVPHAFFNDTRASYRVQAARDAWAKVLAFFNETL